jgi:TonB family protein
MIDIDEKSITIELFHSNYLPAIKYEVVKRGKKNPQFQYRMTPNKELLNSYMQPIIEKVLKILRSVDSIQYASCEEDSMPIRFNAHFPGGDELINIFIKSALVYPEEAIEFGEQGNVFVSFIIEKSGEITTVNIERGISKSLDREAKRLISNMPNWIPEYCNGRPQRVKAQIPIQFVIM